MSAAFRDLVSDLVACALIEGARPTSMTASVATQTAKQRVLDAFTDAAATGLAPQASNEKSPRALIEQLAGYVLTTTSALGYAKALQEIEAALTKSGETPANPCPLPHDHFGACAPAAPAALTSNLRSDDLATVLKSLLMQAKPYIIRADREGPQGHPKVLLDQINRVLDGSRVETTARQVFMYCPGAGLLRCEHQDCIENGCHLVRDGSCSRRALSGDDLVKARELNTELRRAVKTS